MSGIFICSKRRPSNLKDSVNTVTGLIIISLAVIVQELWRIRNERRLDRKRERAFEWLNTVWNVTKADLIANGCGSQIAGQLQLLHESEAYGRIYEITGWEVCRLGCSHGACDDPLLKELLGG